MVAALRPLSIRRKRISGTTIESGRPRLGYVLQSGARLPGLLGCLVSLQAASSRFSCAGAPRARGGLTRGSTPGPHFIGDKRRLEVKVDVDGRGTGRKRPTKEAWEEPHHPPPPPPPELRPPPYVDDDDDEYPPEDARARRRVRRAAAAAAAARARSARAAGPVAAVEQFVAPRPLERRRVHAVDPPQSINDLVVAALRRRVAQGVVDVP